MDIDRDAVRGELPGWLFSLIEWWRLDWHLRDAVLVQDHEPRKLMMEASGEQSDHGPVVDVALRPFDADGFLWVDFQGQPLLKLHWTRLMPGAPLRLDEMGEI